MIKKTKKIMKKIMIKKAEMTKKAKTKTMAMGTGSF